MSTILIEKLTKTYQDKSGANVAVVQNIDLEIKDREFMVLVGPSGCGKSTTLRMIAGLEEISGGTVRIDGKAVNNLPPKDRDIAMVFQNYALYPHMSVYENMAFGLRIQKLPSAEIDQRVHEAAGMLGLEGYLDRRPKALSGGQRQRVAVGRAIVRKPKVFLFDEPLSNLDAKMRASTRTEIAKLHARLGATMVYVTHDQVEAMTMGDRICVMNEGRVMQVAEPLELYNHPANVFVAGFIGSPPMNFFAGTLQGENGGARFTELNGGSVSINLNPRLARAVASHAGRPVILGVRPEDIHLASTAEPRDPASAVDAKVEIYEPMGSETILHLSTTQTPFVSRVGPAHKFTAGEPIKVFFDLDKAHLFDRVTEQLI